MGAEGRPGASLRAFRDFLPGTEIYGADVDRAILFREERISTFFVDQTDMASFAELRAVAGEQGFDVIIDDGLHSPGANLAVVLFALDVLAPQGVLVIEDIKEDALPVWYVVRALLWESCETTLIRDAADYVLVLRPRR
jgi:23S rRNA U2552 (ribose-2'-O)-methylase RlmE/FtsJ